MALSIKPFYCSPIFRSSKSINIFFWISYSILDHIFHFFKTSTKKSHTLSWYYNSLVLFVISGSSWMSGVLVIATWWLGEESLSSVNDAWWSGSSSSVSSNWILAASGEVGCTFTTMFFFEEPLLLADCLSAKLSEGLTGIMDWYQSRLSSNVSRMSWQSGCTRSAHVSHSGCTMKSIKPTCNH